MLSYQHGYHAGNFADVFKHTALTRLLAYLTQKDKPLFYLETHAGKGLYDLQGKQAEKTGESKQGIQLIWPQRTTLPTVFQEYIKAIDKLNTKEQVKHYPGSPQLAIQALRAQDRAYLCELHPAEYDALSTMPCLNKKVHFENNDGIASLKAVLPPPEKRGLIFIDPSYEIKDEYKTIPTTLKAIYPKFETGVYCVWYPVLNKKLTEQFIRRLSAIEAKSTLSVEFNLTSKNTPGMTGCGLWIINPPFTFAEEMKAVCTTLKALFNPADSSFIIEVNP